SEMDSLWQLNPEHSRLGLRGLLDGDDLVEHLVHSCLVAITICCAQPLDVGEAAEGEIMAFLLNGNGNPRTEMPCRIPHLEAGVTLADLLDAALRPRHTSALPDPNVDPAVLLLDRIQQQRGQAHGKLRGVDIARIAVLSGAQIEDVVVQGAINRVE